MEKEKEIIIIKNCQQGKPEQFGCLYDLYVKKIYNFIYYKTFHKETAEDLCAQTFLKALKNINNFALEKNNFSAWLYQIARHTVIDHYRSKKDLINIESVWDLSDDSDMELDIENKNRLNQIKKYLKKLKPQQREIIILRIWDELSYKEIATMTGQSENNCKMIFSRSIRKLRQDIPIILLLILFKIH